MARAIVKRAEATYELDLQRLSHEHSIVRSKIADETWRALIGSGLESLVAYEEGGFKPEHLANLLRLVQAVALIAIAD